MKTSECCKWCCALGIATRAAAHSWLALCLQPRMQESLDDTEKAGSKRRKGGRFRLSCSKTVVPWYGSTAMLSPQAQPHEASDWLPLASHLESSQHQPMVRRLRNSCTPSASLEDQTDGSPSPRQFKTTSDGRTSTSRLLIIACSLASLGQNFLYATYLGTLASTTTLDGTAKCLSDSHRVPLVQAGSAGLGSSAQTCPGPDEYRSLQRAGCRLSHRARQVSNQMI